MESVTTEEDDCILVERDHSLGLLNKKTGAYLEKANISLSIDCFVSDGLDVNHRIAFDIRTSDAKHHIVVMDICNAYSWSKFKDKALRDIKASVISRFYDIKKVSIFQNFLHQKIVDFSDTTNLTRSPIKYIGIQLQNLGMDGTFGGKMSVDRFEYFLNPEEGICNIRGEKKEDPLTIWDPVSFRLYHSIKGDIDLRGYFIYYEDNGADGFLERLDFPFMTKRDGHAYFEELNILLSFLYLFHQQKLFQLVGFIAAVVVQGASGLGKTDICLAAMAIVSGRQNVLGVGTTVPYARDKRTMQTPPVLYDDNSSLKVEELTAVTGSQGFGTGTKCSGEKPTVAGIGFTTNLDCERSARLQTGRLPVVFKDEPSAIRTPDARVDGRDLILHNQGLNSNKRPLGFLHTTCSCWFDGQIEEMFFLGLQRVYDYKPRWPTRKCLQCAFICMWIEMVHELAVNARKRHEEQGSTGSYPGERFLRNGGKVGYYAYMEVWLNKLDQQFSGSGEPVVELSMGAFILRIVDSLRSRFEANNLTRVDLDLNACFSAKPVGGEVCFKLHILSTLWSSFKEKNDPDFKDEVKLKGGVWKGNRTVDGKQIKFHAVPLECVPLSARTIAWNLFSGTHGADMPTFPTDKNAHHLPGIYEISGNEVAEPEDGESIHLNDAVLSPTPPTLDLNLEDTVIEDVHTADQSTRINQTFDEAYHSQSQNSEAQPSSAKKRPASPLLSNNKKIQINPMALVQPTVLLEVNPMALVQPTVSLNRDASEENQDNEEKFKLHDLVWAKVDGRKFLPGKIVCDETAVWKKPGFVFVSIYALAGGDQWVSVDPKKLSICPYCNIDDLHQYKVRRMQVPSAHMAGKHETAEHKAFLAKS